MERYVVFIRKNKTGEEFISARMGQPGSHETIMSAMGKKYPTPDYHIHTTYTEKELGDILNSLNRWCGPAESSGTTKAGVVYSS